MLPNPTQAGKMTKAEFQEFHGFDEDTMALLQYFINQGCKIVKILDKPLG